MSLVYFFLLFILALYANFLRLFDQVSFIDGAYAKSRASSATRVLVCDYASCCFDVRDLADVALVRDDARHDACYATTT